MINYKLCRNKNFQVGHNKWPGDFEIKDENTQL